MKSYQVFSVLLLLTSLLSCQNNNILEFKVQILGEWKFVEYCDSTKQTDKISIPEPPSERAAGFEFFKNGVCKDKLGFYKEEKLAGKGRLFHYLGENTKYEIEDDSLKTYNPITKKWNSGKIYSITKDTLILKISDSLYTKYARLQYTLNPKESYDKIIVSSSGCYGTCPITDVSIGRDGTILYRGIDYSLKKGFYTSKIPKEQYLQMESEFKKANIVKLKNDYTATHTDDQTITVTFIKNNKVYKTISDYGNESPAEFQWAYRPVTYLYQQLKLKPFKAGIPGTLKWSIDFETTGKICRLSKSESFFLVTELCKGKETNVKFTPKYYINYWEDEKQTGIFSDGRYYTFSTKNVGKTIDLGYNFLERNNLSKNFNDKETDD